MKTISKILVLILFKSCQSENATYDITNFGAKGNGKKCNTKEIQNAINHEAKNGGERWKFHQVFLKQELASLYS